MKRTLTGFAMSALLLAAAPAALSAQSEIRSDGWWDWAAPLVETGSRDIYRDDRDRARDRDRDRDRARNSRGARGNQRMERRQGNGPPFCQNGQGHPVHGRRWCDAKGWSATWHRAGWEDVIRFPRDRDRRIYEQDTLADILGRVVFGRLTDQRRQIGADGPLQGRYITSNGARVLQVRAGGIPIAELTDRNGDGRADLILVNRP